MEGEPASKKRRLVSRRQAKDASPHRFADSSSPGRDVGTGGDIVGEDVHSPAGGVVPASQDVFDDPSEADEFEADLAKLVSQISEDSSETEAEILSRLERLRRDRAEVERLNALSEGAPPPGQYQGARSGYLSALAVPKESSSPVYEAESSVLESESKSPDGDKDDSGDDGDQKLVVTRETLRMIARGQLTIAQAEEQLKIRPYETAGDDKVDEDDLESSRLFITSSQLRRDIDVPAVDSREYRLKRPTPSNDGWVDTAEYVSYSVKYRLYRLWRLRPDHSMFGEETEGEFRLPCFARKRDGGHAGNPVTWWSKADDLGRAVAKQMGKRIPVGSCWLVADNYQSRQRGKGAEKVYAMRWNIYRWLAFLNYPSKENWILFRGESKASTDLGSASMEQWARQNPFCHTCNNGSSSGTSRKAEAEEYGETYVKLGCVNGLEHGFFGSTISNNGMKNCSGPLAARWDCPGHPSGPEDQGKSEHCFFVWKNTGHPRPCFNALSKPETCKCPGNKPCF